MNRRISCAVAVVLLAGCAVDRKISLTCNGDCKYLDHGVIEIADPSAANERPAPRILITPNRVEAQ
jgi:hypothetical protein